MSATKQKLGPLVRLRYWWCVKMHGGGMTTESEYRSGGNVLNKVTTYRCGQCACCTRRDKNGATRVLAHFLPELER